MQRRQITCVNMQSGLAILSFVLAVSLSHAAFQNVFNFHIPRQVQNEDIKYRFSNVIYNLLNRYHGPHNRKQKADIVDILMNEGKLKQKINSFKYKDCGGFAGKITSLELFPDPLEFPGDISVSASANLTETLSSPLKAVLSIWMNDTPYICTDGSCEFNVCELLQNVTCPDTLKDAGIPCRCPFQKNAYNLPATIFNVDVGFMETGNYHVNAAVYSGGKKAACIDVYASVGN